MKIVIAGAGETGTHLAKMLAKEKQDIVLLDTNEERLNALSSCGAEMLSIVGNPVSFLDLEQAGVKNADLFVSVTPEESINIIACQLAARLGAQETIARINNDEYLAPKNKEFFESLGITSMIYPERLAAEEIATAISRPWTRQFMELLGGIFVLIGVKIRDNSKLANVRLSDISIENMLYHVVAIKRDDRTYIPNGGSMVLSGDILFFTTTKEHAKDVQMQAGKADSEVKKVFIIGGTRIALITCNLLPSHVRVKLIERDKEKCHRIAETVPDNVLVIHGDGRDLELLNQEGVKDAQAFVGLTDNESANIMACLTAKRYGKVAKTIAEVENIDYIPLAENMDIGTVINKKRIAAGHIYQFLLDCNVTNVKILSFADANVAELIAAPGSKITRKLVKDLHLSEDLTLGGLVRGNEPMIIKGDTQIQADDRVIVFCLDSAIRKLEGLFN
ncbi:Trk system potassium transport protein TrkA [Bacteroidia bacterium]|nr:Trk system potassium transport protein TrkA [Bacteroidia bacterium]GHU56191.1 Trk system potassium transport protein TrkA [Bacteroidia bacterium]